MSRRQWVAVHTNDAQHMAWVTRRKDGAGGSLLVGDQRIDVGVIDPDKANELADWLADALNRKHDAEREARDQAGISAERNGRNESVAAVPKAQERKP